MTMPLVDSFNLEVINDNFLNEKRKHTDPIADEVIAEIIASGYEEKVNEVFMKLVTNESYNPEMFKDLPDEVYQAVTQYFECTSSLPSWADKEKLKQGEELFSLFGPEIFMLLNMLSLPMCYTCRKGAKVLYMTGRLSDRGGNMDPLTRRLMETAQMVVNTMSPGGLDQGGSGIITLQKVRLIHASIRYFLKHERFNPQGWDTEYFGEPINQEDLAGTLMSFGPIILNGLKNLSIDLSKSQRESYLHCWRVIGHLMGIDMSLLPETEKENWELAVKILKHQSGPSDEGKELTRSCNNFIDTIIPGTVFNGVSEYMMWYFFKDMSKATGIDLASTIGVEERRGVKELLVLTISKFFSKKVSHLQEHSHVIQEISGYFNKLLLAGYLKHFNGGKNIHFFIPPSLRKDWAIEEEWQNRFLTPSILGNRLAWQQIQNKN
ncbi:oxygenase MpaB family protein [Marinigracilibium pacificum]|uniref:DUF2236 domain-containing protein n=1 Tax=Marinigracilibium pacificum TaxID=2729599 RepID=A0A848IZN4_9BACT|nr:oxygenase MpaB family protein [Marinigracilibium pacificum]NMM47684.1 DUF2236 domain-containing protein [Marinigracilibium pacificum]